MPSSRSTLSRKPARAYGWLQSKAVFLVGFMGAGKTTTGRALARRLKWRFVDLDDVIVARERRSVADIFAQAGEAGFRAAETAALRAVLDQLRRSSPAVIALGGGAIVQPQNATLVKETGAPVIFLDAVLDELHRRCAARGSARPLYQDMNQFRQLYESRRGAYMAAGERVDTTGKRSPQVVADVLQLLSSKLTRNSREK
jgi:shikimate kinase